VRNKVKPTPRRAVFVDVPLLAEAIRWGEVGLVTRKLCTAPGKQFGAFLGQQIF